MSEQLIGNYNSSMEGAELVQLTPMEENFKSYGLEEIEF